MGGWVWQLWDSTWKCRDFYLLPYNYWLNRLGMDCCTGTCPAVNAKNLKKNSPKPIKSEFTQLPGKLQMMSGKGCAVFIPCSAEQVLFSGTELWLGTLRCCRQVSLWIWAGWAWVWVTGWQMPAWSQHRRAPWSLVLRSSTGARWCWAALKQVQNLWDLMHRAWLRALHIFIWA